MILVVPHRLGKDGHFLLSLVVMILFIVKRTVQGDGQCRFQMSSLFVWIDRNHWQVARSIVIRDVPVSVH